MPKFLDVPEWYGSGGTLCRLWDTPPENSNTRSLYLNYNNNGKFYWTELNTEYLTTNTAGVGDTLNWPSSSYGNTVMGIIIIKWTYQGGNTQILFEPIPQLYIRGNSKPNIGGDVITVCSRYGYATLQLLNNSVLLAEGGSTGAGSEVTNTQFTLVTIQI